MEKASEEKIVITEEAFKVLICPICHHVVEDDNFIESLQDNHAICNSEDCQGKDNTMYDGLLVLGNEAVDDCLKILNDETPF